MSATLTKTRSLADLQAKWRELHAKHRAFTDDLERKYGNPSYIYAPYGKRQQADKLSKRADAAMERVFVWLDDHSPRSWRTHAPCYWTCENLTLDDALTAGQLTVIPPCSYGYYPQDMVRFAAPVRKEERMPSW